MKNKEYVLEIRRRIPVGLTEALKLLEESDFDIDEAEKNWKTEQVKNLAAKISVMPVDAKELLEFVNYDFSKALSIYQQRNTTDLEKILQSSKNEEQVLSDFWKYIDQQLGDDSVRYGGWINNDEFKRLPELISNILLIWQWYAYYDYENVSVEQITTNDVIRILEFNLDLKDFAESLKILKEIVDSYYSENNYDKNNPETNIELRNKLMSSEVYRKIDREIIRNEDLVMKRTYEYLLKNSVEINELLKNTFDRS